MWVQGGTRYGGRYPDIIIDRGDFTRAEAILGKKNIGNQPVDIVKIVRDIFETTKLLQFEIVDGYPAPIDSRWKKGVDEPSNCFAQRIFECKDDDDCARKKKFWPNTMTNITALPLLALADCREHAWLAAFLLSVGYARYGSNMEVSVVYTKSFTVNDTKKTITYLEDHVFVLTIDEQGKVTIVDPLYAENIGKCDACINFNNTNPTLVGLNKLATHTGFDSLCKELDTYPSGSTAPIFRSGQLSIDKSLSSTAYIVSVPFIYDGSTRFIENISDDRSKFVVYNRLIEIPSVPFKRDGWCPA